MTLKVDWDSVNSGLVRIATMPETPLRTRQNLYALKNWIKRAQNGQIDGDSIQPIRPNFVDTDV